MFSLIVADGGGQRALSASAVSQLPAAQNNPYTKVSYFGVAHPNSLHLEPQDSASCSVVFYFELSV